MIDLALRCWFDNWDHAKALIDGGVVSPGLTFDRRDTTAQWYQRTKVYLLNDVIVVKEDLLRRHEWLADELLDIFEQAKVQAAAEGWSEHPTFVDGTHRDDLLGVVGSDPLPNGFANDENPSSERA